MQWRGRRQSDNIEDRRGGGGFFPGGGGGRMPIGFPAGGGARAGGGLGIGAILVLLVIAWVTGINPLELLSGTGGGGPVIVGNDGTGAAVPP
ncbi:MAG TPA: neutral zinc metallopeptidase, partial [Bauldia sp.]|nr:neutral zinc metallopeptidase [Bauldia sp.]